MSKNPVIKLRRKADGSLIAYFNGQAIPAKHINADWRVGEPMELELTISGRFVELEGEGPNIAALCGQEE